MESKSTCKGDCHSINPSRPLTIRSAEVGTGCGELCFDCRGEVASGIMSRLFMEWDSSSCRDMVDVGDTAVVLCKLIGIYN